MTDEEKKQLSADLKQQSNNASEPSIVQNQIDDNSALAEKYLSQIKQPIELTQQPYIENYCYKCHIGNFTFTSLHNKKSVIEKSTEKKDYPNLDQPRNILKSSDFYVLEDPKDPRWKESNLAAYNLETDAIKLQKKSPLSPEEEQKYIASGFKNQSEYLKWNPIAVTANLVHEGTHMKHFRYDGFLTLKKPIDIVKADNLTEKIAFTAENLYAANQYSILKKEGAKNIEINGELQPIESILDMYPGLKETVMDQGFDINNKKDIEKIVRLSSDFWDKNRANSYQRQHQNMVFTHASADNLIQYCAHDDKQYDDVAKKMLKNVYISNNTNVDLSEYRYILDNMTNDKAKEVLADEPIDEHLTYRQVNNVNDYLNTLNLKTEEEKMSYLKQNFEKITLRQEPYDEKLKEVMMQCGTKENQNSVLYADGLTEKITSDGHTILMDTEGKADITTYHQILKTSLSNAKAVQQHQIKTETQKAKEVRTPEEPASKQTTTTYSLTNGIYQRE